MIRPRIPCSSPVSSLRSVSIVADVRAAPFALLLLFASTTLACGDDGGGSAGSFSSDVSNEQVAAGACGLLVDWTNDVADAVNTVQPQMVEGADLQGLMEDTLDDIIERTEALSDDLEALDYPDTDGGHAFADDLIGGVMDAREDLEGFRDEVRAIPDPDPETWLFRKQQMVVELEKPRSLVKPDVQGDLGDADLEAAIAAEDSCDFVTRSQ
jgi:hypothetical protein